MTDESGALSPVSFPRQERHGVLLGLQWYQLAFAGGGILTACLASAAGGPHRLFWTSPLWLSLVFLGFLQYARIPYPVWILTAARFGARKATHQTTFLASPEKPVMAGSLVLPGGLSTLTIHRTADGWCFVVDREAREAFAVIRCRANAFALLEDEDKAYAVQEWSRVQANLAKRPGVARIAIQDYTVHFPASALEEFYRRRVAARKSMSPGTEWGDRSYQDLVSAAGTTSSHDILLTLVLDTARARRRIRDAGGGVAGIEQTLRSELEALATGLKTHGVKVEEWLSDRQFSSILRGAFDPSSVIAIGQRKGEVEGVDADQSGPMGMEEHWSYLQTDTGFHQTFWVAEWPRQKVFAGFLHPLVYVGGFRHAVTQVLRAVPADRALKDIRSAQESHETRRRINAKFDRPTTREQLAEEQEVQQREEEIVAGHGDVRQAAYVTITAATLEELSRCRQELESAAASAFVDLRLLVGQQWAAFIAGGLPLGRGLK
ncbi:SCO6880 family protein [Pseudarthrobacter sp. MDT1-22]